MTTHVHVQNCTVQSFIETEINPLFKTVKLVFWSYFVIEE